MHDAVIILSPEGVTLDGARASIERLRGKVFVNRQTGIPARLSSIANTEALDRKVEVVSGNTPHASSASTPNILAKALSFIKGVYRLVPGGRRTWQ